MAHIILLVLIAFLISFFSLSVFLIWYYNYEGDEFYSENVTSQKKVFLIGSSQIGQLNATHVERYLLANNKDYKVYNLAIPGDTAKERLVSVDKIISLKPSVVVYGVGFRDFENQNLSINENILPSPNQIILNIIPKDLKENLNIFQSPKRVIAKLLLNFEKKDIIESNTPFYHLIFNKTIDDKKELQEELNRISFTGIRTDSENENRVALKAIITKLQQNDIRVIILATPYHKSYLDILPQDYIQKFNTILNEIKTLYGVKIYSLQDEYENTDSIWADYEHVAQRSNALIYSEDVAKMILMEIENAI